MFRWNIAKSVDAMFSRWAIKRVCKFLLKKKLGKFILGDVDLDQLDIQLSKGTVQLTDLALNVDYLNQKLGVTPVIVKEGSIGSVLVRVPWKARNCEIEVEELELVLAPCAGGNLQEDTDKLTVDQDGKRFVGSSLEKVEAQKFHSSAGSISVDVHEGVKTIARMVNWLLTSFNVKVKNLIVAFDPSLEKDEKQTDPPRTLVLRITEAEYGTCVSEDSSTTSDSMDGNFLGVTRLTNFVDFQGAVVELLQTDGVGNLSGIPTASGSTLSDSYAGSLPSCAVTPVLTGTVGGFSGTLKLSIPWKNGSLDIRKVDANLTIHPMELRLQPSTINWIICLWECLKNVGMDGRSDMRQQASDSVSISSASCYHSFTLDTAVTTKDHLMHSSNKSSAGLCSQTSQEFVEDTSLPGPHVISNWVPLLNSKNEKDGAGEEVDYTASIDQFFECFDGMRSSQSALGNSGILNWTCSVFNAITAANSLASGSMHIPSEQQHVETSLRATVVGISVILSLHDDEQEHTCSSNSGSGNMGGFNEIKSDCRLMSSDFAIPTISSTKIKQLSTDAVDDHIGQDVHYLEAKCQNLLFTLQICPQKFKFEATIKQINVDEYFSNGSKAVDFAKLNQESSCCGWMPLFQQLQTEVQGALLPFPSSTQSGSEGEENGSTTADGPLYMRSMNGKPQVANHMTVCKGGLVQVNLLKSLNGCGCQVTVTSTHSDDKSRATISFSVKLPQFILWVDLNLVNILLGFCKKLGNSCEISSSNNLKSKDFVEELESSCQGDVKGGIHPSATTAFPKGSLQGSIFLPQGRIILCFSSENQGCFRHCPWNKFIALDFFPSSSIGKDRKTCQPPNLNPQNKYSCPSSTIHLNFWDLNVYLITSACRSGIGNDLGVTDPQIFSAKKIISVTAGTDDHRSVISMIWQGGRVTGPWIARKARCLAASQDSRRTCNKMGGRGYEFASATAAEGLQQSNSCVLQEMILSSAFVLHACLSIVWINLSSPDYMLLHHLLNQVVDGFTHVAHGTGDTIDARLKREQASSSDDNSSQVTVLVECTVVDLSIGMEKRMDSKCSIQKELPGSWENLRLTIDKFQLLSVSNIGGINGASFVWVSHDEGELCGSLNTSDDAALSAIQNLVLISCRNSTMCRGNGGGTNALASSSAGTAIIHLWDPTLSQSSMRITVRCGTIIAPGGRLDWLNEICSFFSLPSHESEQVDRKNNENDVACGASFFLELVDVALSYEPRTKNSMVSGRVLESKSGSSAKPVRESGEQLVTCLLAAASLNLSNQTDANFVTNDYKIRLQDVGLLLCSLPGSADDTVGTYDVEHLCKSGYVKVAGEALVEAVLRTNCKNGLLWEVECSESHVNVDTCHDTTMALIQLVAQIQQLFAPDIEESVVHLETRSNNVQQAHDVRGAETTSSFSSSSNICEQSLTRELDSRPVVVGLMDEILEDAFDLNRNSAVLSDSHKVQSSDERLLGDTHDSSVITHEADDVFPLKIPVNGSMPESGLKNGKASESLQKACIEGYYISESFPPPQLLANYQSWNGADWGCKHKHEACLDVESGQCGWYKDSSFSIIENHVSRGSGETAGKHMCEEAELPSGSYATLSEFCKPRGRILLKNVDIGWKMYAGSDWPSFGVNIPPTHNAGKRDATVCLELKLCGMSIQYDMFPDGDVYVSKLSLSVRDFFLYDRSKDALWKTVVGYYQSKDHPRESCAKAFKLDLEAVRPDARTPLEEYRLCLALLPIRLNLEQGQLDFLISFFARKDSSSDQSPIVSNDLNGTRILPAIREQTVAEEALLPFFQKFDIWPVIVQVNYVPRCINLAALQGGNYAELLNLVPWKGIELELKHVHAVGVYGWSSVCETIIGEWLEDISHNQVQKLLKGLAPIRSLFAVSSGAAKLVSLPVKSYKKDHRLLKGMQRGAIAFVRSISLEAVGLGIHLAAGAHGILDQIEDILTSIPPLAPSSKRSRVKTHVRYNQPKDAHQGIQQAYESLSDGVGKTASALVGNPIKAYQRGAGAGSALASAVRAAPVAAIAPASAAMSAVHLTLLGVRNSLNPEHKKESLEKYMGHTQPRDLRDDKWESYQFVDLS